MSKKQQRKSVSRSAAFAIPELEQSISLFGTGTRLERVANANRVYT
jgi:hypothetical protein